MSPEEGKTRSGGKTGSGATSGKYSLGTEKTPVDREVKRPAHTRLPFVTMLLLIHFRGREGNTCEKCFCPLYRGDTVSVLIRVHTNMNPKCINHSQLTTCKEDNKIYWLAKSIANPSRRMSGEWPVKERWVCFEQESETNLEDPFKEKEVKLNTQMDKEGQIQGKNHLSIWWKRLWKFNLTDCWVCRGHTSGKFGHGTVSV